MDLSDFLPSLLPVIDIQLTFLSSAVPVLHPSIPFLTKTETMSNGHRVYSTEDQGEEHCRCGSHGMDDHLANNDLKIRLQGVAALENQRKIPFNSEIP